MEDTWYLYWYDSTTNCSLHRSKWFSINELLEFSISYDDDGESYIYIYIMKWNKIYLVNIEKRNLLHQSGKTSKQLTTGANQIVNTNQPDYDGGYVDVETYTLNCASNQWRIRVMENSLLFSLFLFKSIAYWNVH